MPVGRPAQPEDAVGDIVEISRLIGVDQRLKEFGAVAEIDDQDNGGGRFHQRFTNLPAEQFILKAFRVGIEKALSIVRVFGVIYLFAVAG